MLACKEFHENKLNSFPNYKMLFLKRNWGKAQGKEYHYMEMKQMFCNH